MELLTRAQLPAFTVRVRWLSDTAVVATFAYRFKRFKKNITVLTRGPGFVYLCSHAFCSCVSDIPAAARGSSDTTLPSWWASTFCFSCSSVPSTPPPSPPFGTDCSGDRTAGRTAWMFYYPRCLLEARATFMHLYTVVLFIICTNSYNDCYIKITHVQVPVMGTLLCNETFVLRVMQWFSCELKGFVASLFCWWF